MKPTPDEVTKFFDEADKLFEQRTIKIRDYLLLCQKGAELAEKYPESGTYIGASIVSAGSYTRLGEIFDIANELEYPSLRKDWEKMGSLANEALDEIG